MLAEWTIIIHVDLYCILDHTVRPVLSNLTTHPLTFFSCPKSLASTNFVVLKLAFRLILSGRVQSACCQILTVKEPRGGEIHSRIRNGYRPPIGTFPRKIQELDATATATATSVPEQVHTLSETRNTRKRTEPSPHQRFIDMRFLTDLNDPTHHNSYCHWKVVTDVYSVWLCH
jgi:hypothetical protein